MHAAGPGCPVNVTRMRSRAGFERLPNEVVRNRGLSLAAVGLLARLLVDGESYPSIMAIAEAYGRGRDGYLAAAKELEAAGHLVRIRSRGASGRMFTTITIYAEPQVTPTTGNPDSVPPAKTNVSAGGTDYGKSGVGPTSADNPLPQVEPTTETPEPVPPAETGIGPGRTDYGFSVVPPIRPVTDPDHRPPPPTPSAPQPPGGSTDQGGGENQRDASHPPNPAAVAVIDALPYTRRPNRRERNQLLAAATAFLAAGFTDAELKTQLTAGLETMHDRVRVWITRLDPEYWPDQTLMAPPARASPEPRASPPRPPCASGNCRACDHEPCSRTGQITRDDETVIRCPCWHSVEARF